MPAAGPRSRLRHRAEYAGQCGRVRVCSNNMMRHSIRRLYSHLWLKNSSQSEQSSAAQGRVRGVVNTFACGARCGAASAPRLNHPRQHAAGAMWATRDRSLTSDQHRCVPLAFRSRPAHSLAHTSQACIDPVRLGHQLTCERGGRCKRGARVSVRAWVGSSHVGRCG